MKIYTVEDIERTFAWLEENDDQAEEIFKELDKLQPNILAFLFSDNHVIFSNNEKELLVFACLVLYKCTMGTPRELISMEEIEQIEGKNYALVNEKLSYDEQINLFFKGYPQEDLLAFIEDFISDEEDDEYAVNPESKLPIFITLKTISDCLTMTQPT